MAKQSTYLIFGATGQTGKHFLPLILDQGHKARVLVRDPAKLLVKSPRLQVHQGSISDASKFDDLLHGVNYVVAMLGDAQRQSKEKMNTAFVEELIPAMRRQHVQRSSTKPERSARRTKAI